MGKRIDQKEREIGRQRIWPTIAANLIILVVLTLCVLFGILFWIGNEIQERLTGARDAARQCALAVDARLAAGGRDAERYAEAIADGYYDANTSRSLYDQLLLLKSIGGYADVGVIEKSGLVTSTDSTLRGEAAADLYRDALAGAGGAHAVATESESGVVFAAPVRTSTGVSGALYAADFAGLDLGAAARALAPESSAFCILDAEDRVVSYLGGAPASFDYAKVAASGLLFPPEREPRPLDLLRAGAFPHPFSSLVSASVNVDAWFETPLTVNGWRAVGCVPLRFDRFLLRQAPALLFAALVAIGLPLFFMVRSAVLQVRSNRIVTEALLFDPITGGNNFTHFKQQAERLFKKRRHLGSTLALAVIDVNRFRAFSDVHGYAEGELLLVRIFNSLKKNLRSGELLTRFSVDQFSLLLILEPEEEPTARVERMTRGLSRLYPSERITCSAGVYVVTDRGMSVDRMNSLATVAKDNAKQAGAGSVLLFDNTMRDRLVSEQQMTASMERALKRGEFVLYLQPKYSVQDRILCGAEALVRWVSPERGFTMPGEFIELFEKNGFITRLDDYVLTAVCRLQRRWINEGRTPVPVSVNLSRRNFSDPGIVQRICAIVDGAGVPHEYIEFELTESAFFEDTHALLGTMHKLCKKGFAISMDDFGSGYSALNSLKDLPLDVVKLDRQFFTASNAERGRTVIRDTIRLVKDLGMSVVAEGIETSEQVRFLQETGCDLVQGYYFAKPMPVEEFEQLPSAFGVALKQGRGGKGER